MSDIIRPHNQIAREKEQAEAKLKAESKTQEDELMMKAYADYLDELKESNPEEYKKIIDDMMKQSGGMGGLKTPGGTIGKDGKKTDESIPSIEIEPKPGFVVKTKNPKGPNGDAKVFINICSHTAIKNFSKKVQLMEDGTEQEGLSVPCSVGPPRPETDKAGKPAVVFDVIVNPQVIKDTKDDVSGSTRHWLIEIAMDRIDSKYNTQLDRRYKLPKAKYKGTVAKQRIRAVDKPKIEPVSMNDEKKTKKSTSKTKSKTQVKKLPLEYCKYTLSYRDIMSSGMTGTQDDEASWSVCPIPGEGSLPNPCAADLDLDIIPAQLRLSVPLPRLATIRPISTDGTSSVTLQQRNRVDVETSPWMVVVKAESYHAVEVMLPYPVFCEVDSIDEENKSTTDQKENDVDMESKESKESKEAKESTKDGGAFFDCVYD